MGKPEYIDEFHALSSPRICARSWRELGFRTVNEMIGRSDRLEMRKAVEHWKARGLDFSKILYQPDVPEDVGRYHQIEQFHGLDLLT